HHRSNHPCHKKNSPQVQEATKKAGREYRKRHPKFSESSDSFIDKNELENSFQEKDPARHQAEKNRRFWPIDGRLTKPSHNIFHCRLAFLFGCFVDHSQS